MPHESVSRRPPQDRFPVFVVTSGYNRGGIGSEARGDRERAASFKRPLLHLGAIFKLISLVELDE